MPKDVCDLLPILNFRERTETAQAAAKAREEQLQQKVEELETAKKEVEESLESHLEEASQQVQYSAPQDRFIINAVAVKKLMVGYYLCHTYILACIIFTVTLDADSVVY